ncbi:colicin V production protein [Melghirimyces profundicolus]|uniref:Colicin V production protein n=1 Tax=Melghirimyces profundicolus TaxID=1242148 RepID=A0A2T6BG34_9BACL|nr:CvpA family protein [Melghirimyces profundicolus]PTX55028.1 colicin V production protein [Melghirimyces profundicolus]
MNLMDWIIVLMIIGGLIQGYRKGLIKETVSLVGVLLALFVAYQFSSDLTPALKEVVPLPESVSGEGWGQFLPVEQAIYSAIAFVVLFLITKVFLSFVAAVLTQLTSFPVLNQINGVGGALIGFLKAFLVLVIAVNLLHILPWAEGRDAVNESSLSQGILEMTPDVTGEFKKMMNRS